MLTAQRRQAILALLRETEAVQVNALAERYGVSEVTIRRDLNALESEAGVRRIHGGALLDMPSITEPPLNVRQVVNHEEKVRIGTAAAELVEDGDTLIISGGTTTAELAYNLTDRDELLVTTPTINVAKILADSPGVTVIITGGILVGSQLTLAGHLAENALSSLHAKKLFFGVSAMDIEHGLSSAHPGEIGVDQAMLKAADLRIALADHTKLGRCSTFVFGAITDVDVLITDDQAAPEFVAELRELGVEVILT